MLILIDPGHGHNTPANAAPTANSLKQPTHEKLQKSRSRPHRPRPQRTTPRPRTRRHSPIRTYPPHKRPLQYSRQIKRHPHQHPCQRRRKRLAMAQRDRMVLLHKQMTNNLRPHRRMLLHRSKKRTSQAKESEPISLTPIPTGKKTSTFSATPSALQSPQRTSSWTTSQISSTCRAELVSRLWSTLRWKGLWNGWRSIIYIINLYKIIMYDIMSSEETSCIFSICICVT